MGQHKTNPTAILVKEGKLQPKKRTKRLTEAELSKLVREVMIKHIFKGERK